MQPLLVSKGKPSPLGEGLGEGEKYLLTLSLSKGRFFLAMVRQAHHEREYFRLTMSGTLCPRLKIRTP